MWQRLDANVYSRHGHSRISYNVRVDEVALVLALELLAADALADAAVTVALRGQRRIEVLGGCDRVGDGPDGRARAVWRLWFAFAREWD